MPNADEHIGTVGPPQDWWKDFFSGLAVEMWRMAADETLTAQEEKFLVRSFPDTMAKLSYGPPKVFVRKHVFAMYADNHHGDGHRAVWIPAPAGVQAALIEAKPQTFFRPPYVGGRGWIGVGLGRIGVRELTFHVRVARSLIDEKYRKGSLA